MNREMIEGRWRMIAGRLKERWGAFSNDELTAIAGRREQQAGRLLLRYGEARAEAVRQLALCERLHARRAQSTAWHRTY